MTKHKVKNGLTKTLAVITLIVIIAPLFPPAAFAQDATPGTDTGTTQITQSSYTPAPSGSGAPSDSNTPTLPTPTGLDFNVNPNGSSPSVSPQGFSSEGQPTVSAGADSDSALFPPPAISLATPSISPNSPLPPSGGAPAVNEVVDSQRSQPLEIVSNTGGFSYSYPISVPPGRNNLQPDLKLAYATDNTELRDIFGESWSMNIPYIQRENKYGVDKLYSATTSPLFFSSIDGELATTTVTSVYAARVENGSFNSYTFSNNQWLVKDKRGVQYKYGYSASTRQDDPNNSSNAYKWMLEEVRDTNDNYISYAYYKDNGQIYPSSISYTGNGATPGVFEVDVLRESRADTATSAQTGFAVKTNYRINEIDAKVNGSLVRKYALAYITGANGTTSLLSSITETGYDESSHSTTLPATTFTYKSNTPGWTRDDSWNFPSSVAWTDNGVDYGYKLLDVNGDGLPDIEYSESATSGAPVSYQPFTNNGHNWTSDSSWNLPVTLITTGAEYGYKFVDVNGDGLTDIEIADSSYGTQAYINNGHGWTVDSSWNLPVTWSNAGVGYGYEFADVNGDRLPDIEYANNNGGPTTFESYINNGHGWTRDDSWNVPPAVPLTTNGVEDGYNLIDVNGDGLPDIEYGNVTISGNQYQAYINNGHGWTLDANWNLPTPLQHDGIEYGYRFVDVNSDGLPDIEYGNSPGGGPTTFQSYINNGEVIDQLTEISYPAGGKMDVQYKQVAGYFDGSNNLTNTSVPFFLNTVYKITTSDGTTTSTSDAYNYKGGTFQYSSPYDKKFAAFGEIDKTDNAGNVTKTFYHTGNGTDSTHGEYQDDYWKIGKPYRVEKYDATGNLFDKAINKWDVATSTTSIAGFVKLAQTVDFAYDGQSTHKDKAESYTCDNVTGNQTQKIEWGQVTGNDDGTFTDTGSDDYTTNITYATSPTSSVLNAVDDTVVTDHSSSKVKESQLSYDNLAFGVVDKGNQTEEDDWKVGSVYITSLKAYNSYGLVATSTDPRGKITSYVYDGFNIYPATTTRPLGLISQAAYNYATGKVDETIDENGNKFLNTYDGLGRPTLVQQPDPSATSSLLTNTAYVYNDITGSVSMHQVTYLSSATTVDSYTYYDGLKRIKQTRKSAEFGNYETRDLVYNTIGLLQQESLPYFSVGSANTAATTTPALFTTYAYDALQRTVTTVNAVGTTTQAYVNWKTTVTDANGKKKDLLNDAYGNLIEVDEHNASSTYVTTYTYNGLNALTNLTDALGNVRNFTYDGLGRRLTAQDLHASGDATYGTWNYTYDDAGNLTQVVDPNNQTINRTYDDLNRILTEDYAGQAGTEVAYTYDSCTEGLTRLCTTSSSAITVNNTYNALGQLTQESKTISGTSTAFVTSYTYDRQGNQLTITSPDNSQVQYSYNIGGRVETIRRKEITDASFSDVVKNFDYSPTGKVAFQVNANCTQTTNTYDSSQLYRLTNKLTTNPCQQSMGMMMAALGSGNSNEQMNDDISRASPGISPQLNSITPMTTILGWNSKTEIVNGGANKRYEFHAKQINFKDADGTFKPINITPTPTATGWEVTQNTFIAMFPARSGGIAEMVNNNRFDTRTLVDINEPVQTMTITALGVSDVAGVLEYGDVGYGPEWYVRYPQAYPAENADLIYLVWQGKVPRLQKLVRFNSALSSDSDFSFQFTYPDKDPDFIPSTGVTWNKASPLATSRAISVGKTGDKRGFGMKNFAIWDTATGTERKISALSVDIAKNAKGYVLTKHIPASFFPGVVYPAFTDTTVTVYPDPDPETTTVDGYFTCDTNFGCGSAGNWSSVVNAGSSKAVDYTAINISALSRSISSRKIIERAALLFDTSVLGVGSTVTSATLSVMPIDFGPDQGAIEYDIYSSNPSSNTSLVKSDYSSFGSTAFSTAIAPGDMTAGVYVTYSLNSSGLAAVSPTGITKLGIRESVYDVGNTNPPDKESSVRWYSADEAGTSQDPMLVIGYIPNYAPIAPTNLLAEGQTSPTGVTDFTPEMSAIYNDPDATDTAHFYRLQVSTSSTNWSSPMWDSGTTSMATTNQGTRSPDISYAGTPLAFDGSTYYWRIKFWDADGAEGLFSTSTASFTMLNNHAPTAPTSLLADGQANPTGVLDARPTLSAVYNDPDTTNVALYYQIQVSPTSSNWSNLVWDSGKTAMATTTQGGRSPDIRYGGSPLALNGSTYYWHITFWDTYDAEGAYSATASISMVSSAGPVIQNISYTYDAVGNITTIVNSSATDASSTVTYAYDDLYRLTSASAAGTPNGISGYSQTFSYDALGNLLSKSDQGSYIYATSSSTGYANPDAAITIAGSNIAYDNNGNVLSASSTTSSGWSVNSGTWARRIPITINHTKVSGNSNLTNFPILFSVTSSAEFKSVSNGGYVASATGWDIFFTSSGGSIKLNHELEKYTATSGQVIAWVEIPTLATSIDTVIYMYYGNASASDQENVSSTWDSNFKGVWHLKENPTGSAPQLKDSTSDGYNGTSNGGQVAGDSQNGKIGNALHFDGSNDYVDVGSAPNINTLTNNLTVSAWIDPNSGTGAWDILAPAKASSTNGFALSLYKSGSSEKLQFNTLGVKYYSSTGTAISASVWTHVAAAMNNNNVTFYINGVAQNTIAGSSSGNANTDDNFRIGATTATGTNTVNSPFPGIIDEVQVSNVVRSSDWIKTSYTNESSSSFFTLGSASSNTFTAIPTTHYTWDYLNRLAQAISGSSSSTYGYDPSGQRVYAMVATSVSVTTYYPTRFYNITYGISTKHIFANGEVVADVIGTATSATTTYIHVDHLGGSNVLTDGNGAIGELLDYMPYGSSRLDEKTSFNEQRKFIGEMYDSASNLSYLNARYYDGAKAKFISQDPVFLGDPKSQILADPQSLNSYSYANGNPIVNKDPMGLATYISDNGAGFTGKDSWNKNTYYQSGDRALLNSNASFGEANRGNSLLFANQVKPGGSWDYKRNTDNRGFYFFGDKLVTGEQFGNLNYGFTGTAFGIGKDKLTDAGGVVQILTSGKDNSGPTMSNVSGNFDDPRDTANIRSGVAAYNASSRPNSSSAYATVSNAVYNLTARPIVRGLSALGAAIVTLANKLP